MVPFQIQQEIAKKLNTRIITFAPVSGGCISNGGKLETANGIYFLKWNSAENFPKMFQKECKGLDLLRKTNTVSTPEVVLTGEMDGWQYIVMEWIGSGTSHYAWKELGAQVARLHQHSNNDFGLDQDNYIGSLIQKNTLTKSWIDFFISCRLAPQLRMLRDSGKVDRDFNKRIETLYPKLEALLPNEPPALVHGDLWSGNVVIGTSGPFVIDPAVYYGHREAEIAFTKLFGCFEKSFYEAYEQEYPLQPGIDERADLYNMYPLLVHANLFGSSYALRVASIVKKYA